MAATSSPSAPSSADDWGDFVAAAQSEQPLHSPKPQPHSHPERQLDLTLHTVELSSHAESLYDSPPLSPRSPNSSFSTEHSQLPNDARDIHCDNISVASNPLDTGENAPISNPVEPSADEQATSHREPHPERSALTPLQGFDTLDQVQRYALGAVAVVLLNDHAADLNGAAFARSQAATILKALGLSEGQQTALLALEPETESRDALVEQCTTLVGDDAPRFAAIQAMLALSVASGCYDARSRAFLAAIADKFGIAWRSVAAVELAVAMQLFEQATAEAEERRASEESMESVGGAGEAKPKTVDELLIERRKKKMRYRRAAKIGGITLVGGVLFGLTGGLIAPGLLTALAGVGVTSAAGLAASGTMASGAVVGGLFGVAGAGFSAKKAKKRVSTSLDEFDFERPDDPRVVEERKKKAEKERKKLEKLIAQRLREEAEATAQLAIEGASETAEKSKPFDAEKALPRPPSEDEDENEDNEHKKKSMWKRKKKRVKLKVGSRGLEAASNAPGLHVCICVPAWLTEKTYGAALDQFEPALKHELPCSQHIALRWESSRLYEMGLAFAKFWASKATVTTLQQTYPHVVAAASTVAGAVAFAFAMPLTVMSCMDYVDNPWSVLVSRSNGAGDELADVLVERSYGQRPVSLFGYSIGARVIFNCLESLASRGALGIVDNVYLMGAAVTAEPDRWKKIRPVVAGRIVNAYGSFDMALACLHRGFGHGVFIAGLRKVEVEGVENLNMAYIGIEGHKELKDCVPRVMKFMGIGLGYIIMPPARLVKKSSKSKSNQRSDSPECEEPGGLENESRSPSAACSPADGSNANKTGVNEMQSDDLKLPPNMSSSGELESDKAAEDSSSAMNGKNSNNLSKKKKPKSWLSWGTWGTSGSNSGNKSKQKLDQGSLPEEANPSETNGSGVVETVSLDDVGVDSSDEAFHEHVDVVTTRNVFDEKADRGEHIVFHEGGMGHSSDDDIIAIVEEGEGSEEAFDWEKQRRIWEEQERQIQERGYADTAVEIEMKSKVILGIGIEVAGRRICPLIDQDSKLPVARKEDIFTNCMEDQQGVIVRVYEHEKRTKSVPINTLKHDEQYPKLLGDLEVRFKEKAVKGKIRVAVTIWALEDGDICVEVEERLEEGAVGNKAELHVPRSELCTMDERIRLEAAELKRIEAQIQKEMRARSKPDVLALPAVAKEDVAESARKEVDSAQRLSRESEDRERGELGMESSARSSLEEGRESYRSATVE